jgi:hypothetical protein
VPISPKTTPREASQTGIRDPWSNVFTGAEFGAVT